MPQGRRACPALMSLDGAIGNWAAVLPYGSFFRRRLASCICPLALSVSISTCMAWQVSYRGGLGAVDAVANVDDADDTGLIFHSLCTHQLGATRPAPVFSICHVRKGKRCPFFRSTSAAVFLTAALCSHKVRRSFLFHFVTCSGATSVTCIRSMS